MLKWFEEHDDEFQFMSCPPNSTDINSIEHISDCVLANLVQSSSCYLPRTRKVMTKWGCNWFTCHRWIGTVLGEWSLRLG